jgi:hypothetical protein
MIGKNKNLSFATVNIAATANEDRYCNFLNHYDDGFRGEFSSFGLFDGHNGVKFIDFI